MQHSRQLYHFLVTAEQGSLTGAAREIGVTQPALSHSIKQLEDHLQVKLFERLPSGISLTAEGHILARRVKLMSLEYRHALAEISDLHQGVRGRLRISAGPTWLMHYLPPIIDEFQQLYPDVRISLIQGGFTVQIGRVLSGEVDAMCGTLDFPDHAEIIKEPVNALRQAVFASKDHPLVSKEFVTPQDLASYSWVVLADDPISTTRIGSFFVANNLEPPNIAVETNSLGAVSLLRKTNYLSLFAIQGRETLVDMGLVDLKHSGTFWDFQSGIARLKTTKPPAALQAFSSLVRSKLGAEQGV